MSQSYPMLITCENGHQMTIYYSTALGRDFVEIQAQLLSGDSRVYAFPPGPESPIGKCGLCQAPISCLVGELVEDEDIIASQPTRDQKHVVLDWNKRPRPQVPDNLDICVDGRTIREVFFVDMAAGVVKHYQVVPPVDPTAMWARMNGPRGGLKDCLFSPADFPGRDVTCEPGQVMYETLRGKVQVVDRDTREVIWGEEE